MTRLFAITSAILTTAIALPAQTWNEAGDAGNLPGTAQGTFGEGVLSQINGMINDTNVTPAFAGNDKDMYLIRIDDPASFSAVTSSSDDLFNGQLFLFGADGLGVTHHDNILFSFFGERDLNARLTSTHVTSPGLYYLAVSRSDRDPTSGGAEIWLDMPFAPDDTAPDGPGAAGVPDGWNGSNIDGNTMPYSISLTGASYSACSDLTITGGAAGTTLDVTVTGADPNAHAYLAFSASQGSTTIKAGPAVLELGLAEPIGVFVLMLTDETGTATRSINIADDFPSLDLFGQAVTWKFLPPPPAPRLLEFCASDVEAFHVGG